MINGWICEECVFILLRLMMLIGGCLVSFGSRCGWVSVLVICFVAILLVCGVVVWWLIGVGVVFIVYWCACGFSMWLRWVCCICRSMFCLIVV